MGEEMSIRTKETKEIDALSVHIGERRLHPTQDDVAKMMKSIEAFGQIHPIRVYPITSKTYQLISGATRLQAFIKLGEKKILATVCVGDSSLDYEIEERVENVERRGLSVDQRRELRAEIKELQKQALVKVIDAEPAKGGRGKKGGLANAAREAGIPLTTAQRRATEAKPTQNAEPGRFSEPQERHVSAPRESPPHVQPTHLNQPRPACPAY